MVGGRLIEIIPYRMRGTGRDVLRLWVMDGEDECIVFAEHADCVPRPGESIFWQAGRIYFDRERRHLTKVGYSFNPQECDAL